MYNDCSKCTGTGEAICLTCHKKEIAEQKDENTATFEALRDKVAELEAENKKQTAISKTLAVVCEKVELAMKKKFKEHGVDTWGDVCSAERWLMLAEEDAIAKEVE